MWSGEMRPLLDARNSWLQLRRASSSGEMVWCSVPVPTTNDAGVVVPVCIPKGLGRAGIGCGGVDAGGILLGRSNPEHRHSRKNN